MVLDDDSRYRAVASRDQRFDGWFFVGVTSTGIFCRPSCPATTPRRRNITFHPSAAAAQREGFRACRRCRPETAPGSPEWDVRGDLANRAMLLINDGVVDREGVGGVAKRLAVSERHLHRILVAELGAAPVALARSRRAQTARLLIETTALPFTEIAFAAGFASIRQFNDTVRDFFGASPSTLRADRSSALRRSRAGTAAAPPAPAEDAGATPISLRLAVRRPFAGTEVVGFLAARAIDGVEAVDGDGTYRRVLRLPGGLATVALRPADDHVAATVVVCDLADLGPAVARCRRLLDLDADPTAVDDVLAASTVLEPLVRATPGRRSPGAVDGTELLVRAIIGQQVSVAGARTVAARVATALGDPVPASLQRADASDALCIAFPTAERLADADPALFSMPRSRAAALSEACSLVARGEVDLDPGADRVEAERRLLAVKGIGPWTTAYIAMRALHDPDVFLPTDLGVRRGLGALGGPDGPTGAATAAEAWRPWRSYALHHLWAAA